MTFVASNPRVWVGDQELQGVVSVEFEEAHVDAASEPVPLLPSVSFTVPLEFPTRRDSASFWRLMTGRQHPRIGAMHTEYRRRATARRRRTR